MTNEVIEMIQYMIDFESKMIRRSVSGILLGTVAGIVFLLIIIRWKFQKRSIPKNYQKYILRFCMIFICLFSITSLYQSEGKRWKRVSALNTDLQNLKISSLTGSVDNIFSYQKGGNAVIIGGQTYYIMPNIGSMKPGLEFKFKYLTVSKFIVSFEVTKDEPVPETAEITEDMLWRFSDSAFEPVQNINMVDSLAYQYIRSYYEAVGGENAERFRKGSWSIYSYYIKANALYRCNIESKDEKIFLVIDAETGEPVYFWTVDSEENRKN